MLVPERIESGLRAARREAGLSLTALAERASTTRQTIAALETGAYPPTMPVALRLARALNRDVGTLFWLEGTREVTADYIDGIENARVRVGRVGSRVVALAADPAGTADGIVTSRPRPGVSVAVTMFEDPSLTSRTAIVAGCDPALPSLGAHLTRRHPTLRILTRMLGSMAALESLRRGEAHAAGLHLRDATSDEWNVPFVRNTLPGRDLLVVTIAHWSLGLLLAPGNPRGIERVDDLFRGDVSMVNREPGSGGRAALDRALTMARADRLPRGYDRIVGTHAAVAGIVAAGFADAGPGIQAAAQADGLGFIPLEEERFDLVIPAEFREYAPIQALLETLISPIYRSELAALPGYDLSATGKTVWQGRVPDPRNEGASSALA